MANTVRDENMVDVKDLKVGDMIELPGGAVGRVTREAFEYALPGRVGRMVATEVVEWGMLARTRAPDGTWNVANKATRVVTPQLDKLMADGVARWDATDREWVGVAHDGVETSLGRTRIEVERYLKLHPSPASW